MKKLLLVYLALLVASVALAQRFPPGPLVSSKKAAAGGGPDVWYDIQSSATGDTTDNGATSSTLYFSTITPSQSGTCTKIRIYQQSSFSAFNVKAGLWNNDKTQISGANGSVASGANGTYLEITLSTPASVTGGTAYYIGWEVDSANMVQYYKASTGEVFYDNGGSYTYANFPNGNLPAGSSLTRSYCVGMYVD